MLRVLWLLVALGLCAGAFVLAIFGTFLLLYQGDSPGGDSYVEIAGNELDAQPVGAASLAVAVGMILAAWVLARRRPT